jgi:hypothetical protein
MLLLFWVAWDDASRALQATRAKSARIETVMSRRLFQRSKKVLAVMESSLCRDVGREPAVRES